MNKQSWILITQSASNVRANAESTLLLIAFLLAPWSYSFGQTTQGACCLYESDGSPCQTESACVDVRVIPPNSVEAVCQFACAQVLVFADQFCAQGFTCPPTVAPLPVELVALTAHVVDTEVVLQWETASETNNAGFDIELEVGSEVFDAIGFVEGSGTTTNPATYRFIVSDLEPGRHRFRLKQIDLDGAYKYSQIVEATVEVPGQYILEPAYPNPFNPSTTIRFAVAAEQRVRAELFNAAGQPVMSLYDALVPGNEMQSIRVDATDLPSGTYLVRLTGRVFETSQSITLVK